MENRECLYVRAAMLVFSCSGGADVGAISDLAARRLTELCVGKMFCPAGVGGRVSGILRSTEATDQILAIDGCSLDCTRRTLQEASFTEFVHLRLADPGLIKGESPPSPDSIGLVVSEVQRVLGVAFATTRSVDDQQGNRRSRTSSIHSASMPSPSCGEQ